MPKLVWRLKVVAELQPGVVRETEVARIERDEQADLADLGLRLVEMKQLTAALQAAIVPAQVAVVGELGRCCASCGRRLASKGHYPVTFRSLFGDVPVRVRRLLVCPCRGVGEAKRGLPEFPCKGLLAQASLNLSSNRIANWALAIAHSREGILHSFAARCNTRYRSFRALSSVGKCPRARTARRSFAFKASIAFVV